jgi:hypothetical protein
MLSLSAAPAVASGFYGEGSYAHVAGTDGGEAGVGYTFDVGPLNVTPIIGGYAHDSDVQIYGKGEVTLPLLGFGEVGGGVRIAHETRPYGTVAFSPIPMISIKGNVGDHYYSAGLSIRF